MPTTKTKKATTPASRKSTKPEKATAASKPKKRRMTVSDLQRKVMDPKNRRSLLLALGVIVLAALLYLGRGLFIAATVNGQPVSRLAIIQDLERQSGKMALESVITRSLVYQEAAKKNIAVSDQEIDAEIAKIQKQFSDQGQNLDQLLEAQGLSKEKFREEVRIQILVTKILGNDAKVTDKEFNDFLAKNQDLLTNETDQDAAKASLRQQMEQQKLAQKYQEWIENVKKNAKINYFVEY